MNKEIMDTLMTMILVNKLGGSVKISKEEGKKAMDMMFIEGKMLNSNIDGEGNFIFEIKKENKMSDTIDSLLKQKEEEEKELEDIFNKSQNISSAKEAKELLDRLVDLTDKHDKFKENIVNKKKQESLKEKIEKENDEYEVEEAEYNEESYKMSVIIAYLLKKLKIKEISIPKEEFDNISKTVVGVSIKINEDGMGVEIHE